MRVVIQTVVYFFSGYGMYTFIDNLIEFYEKRKNKRIQEVLDALDGKSMNRQSITQSQGFSINIPSSAVMSNVSSGKSGYVAGPFSSKGPISSK